jgi:hypothetical protein
MEIIFYEMSARRHFSRLSVLFEARATKEQVLHLRECGEYVFSHRTIFFETNIMSDLSYSLVNRMALVHAIAKVSIELIAIYFHFF